MQVHISLLLALGFQHTKQIFLLVWACSEKVKERTAKGDLQGLNMPGAYGVCI